MNHPTKTLLALTAAAAFGGFAATAIHDALDTPAQAAPATAATVPAIAALPAAVDGQAVAVAGADAAAGDCRRWSACTPSSGCGSTIRSPTIRCSGACSRTCRRSGSTSRWARA